MQRSTRATRQRLPFRAILWHNILLLATLQDQAEDVEQVGKRRWSCLAFVSRKVRGLAMDEGLRVCILSQKSSHPYLFAHHA